MGMLYLEKMCIMKNNASSGAVMSLVVGMKMPCLESQSTTTRMVVCPEDKGRCSIKSIEIDLTVIWGMGVVLRNCRVCVGGP